MLLQQLITQKTLSLAAVKQGLVISAAQVNAILLQIPAFQLNGQFSQAQFSMVLNNNMLTPEQFMQNMRATLLVDQFQKGIAGKCLRLAR